MRSVLFSLVFLGVCSASNLLAQDSPRRPFLFKDARGELAQARVRGEEDILLVIAAMPGQAGPLASAIARVGGTVQLRDDDVDYLRARVPLDRVEEFAGQGVVGELAPTSYSFYGFQWERDGFLDTAIQPMIDQMRTESVDAVLLTPA